MICGAGGSVVWSGAGAVEDAEAPVTLSGTLDCGVFGCCMLLIII